MDGWSRRNFTVAKKKKKRKKMRWVGVGGGYSPVSVLFLGQAEHQTNTKLQTEH
jgi:hypothetical protein